MGDLRVLFREILATISIADSHPADDGKISVGYKNVILNYRESLSPERDRASFFLNYKLAALGVKIEESLFHRFSQSYSPLSKFGIHNDKLSIQSTVLRLFDRLDSLEESDSQKNQEDGVKEGAEFIQKHIIKISEKAFDDFAS